MKRRVRIVIKKCAKCGKDFESISRIHRFCSVTCQMADYGLPTAAKIPSGSVGAASELRVCADLLRKGYEVFRSVSQSTSCDLVIRDVENRLSRVEVKTGYESKTGRVIALRDNVRADIFAIVLPDRILYFHGTVHQRDFLSQLGRSVR